MNGRTRVAMAMASLVAGCAEDKIVVDTSEVIALRLEGDWTDEERQAAANAATAWNVEFGTRARIAEFGDEEAVPIEFTSDACVNSRNQMTHARATTDPPAIGICPATADDRLLLFETIRHELGHILGIPVHATDGFAVMTGRATNLVHWFRDEDRDLFFGGNEGFVGETGCAVSPRIADGTPMLAHPADHPLHLVWAKDSIIRFAPLSRNGLLGAEAGRIITQVAAARLDAHPTENGFLVTWFEENRINFSTIGLADKLVSETRTVELDWPLLSFYRVSEGHAAPYYWLALTVRESETNLPRTLHLFQFDDQSGAIISSSSFPMTHGELVIHEGQPLLITAAIDTTTSETDVRLHRIQARPDGFDLTESLDVASVPYVLADLWATPEPVLTAQSTTGGVVMLLQKSSGMDVIDLVRVTTQGQLALEKTFMLHSGRLNDPVIIQGPEHVFVAGTMPSSTHYEDEVYLLKLASDTLETVEPWLLLSAADTVAAEEPRLAISGDNLVAVWKDSLSGDVRSRCVRPVP